MIIQTKSAPPLVAKQRPRRRWAAILVAGLFACFVFVVEALSLRPVRFAGWFNSFANDTQSEAPFSWDNVKPSDVLSPDSWCDCYGSRQCARLIVPRSYSDPKAGTAVIALTRVVSSFPVDSPEYRGPVLINPGGPGGSGVDFAAKSGEAISKIIGPQFDVVGFDPRGVGHSTPKVSCFGTPEERALWGEGLGIIGKGADGLSSVWARAQIFGQLASYNDANVLEHINTDNTARDMLRIVQAHKREKLQYWGFSYGSVLGATFAAMFPDKVERLVIDGVVDAENYYSTLWDNNLLDTDKTLQAFFEGCALAGPEQCPFYASTPEEISQNLTTLYNTVSARPVPVYTQAGYGLVDYARLRLTVFSSLYKPYQTFPFLAKALADLAAGDGTALYQMLVTPRFKCSCSEPEPFVSASSDAQVAIMCGDGQVVPPDLESTEEFYRKFSDTSHWADAWARLHIICSGWPKLPKTHFQGPFVAKTSFPLLLIGNTADPVTPLWAAKKMSAGFSGSVVLTQDSAGHCSASGPSLCTQKYVRDYFVDGKLPPVGEVCPVIGTPFPKQAVEDGPDGQASFISEDISPEDRGILDAIEQIQSSLSFGTQQML